ncbi:hypothetical protein [Methylocapsa acidiphila]|uniref:hypothetical protein n=1 Tax=Methylocapsa acidiphila TaxID=133552 RepID=UPI0004173811|nr:hypothetical protein [Methylocapsa acidiphila]
MGVLVQFYSVTGATRLARRPDLADEAPREDPRWRSRGLDAPLDCLAGRALASRFHAWRGLSGRRYVCSVFPAEADALWGGLPEFDKAIVLAVALDSQNARRQISAFELEWREGRFCGQPEQVREALRAGVREWHVHLLTESPHERRAALADLTASRLAEGA